MRHACLKIAIAAMTATPLVASAFVSPIEVGGDPLAQIQAAIQGGSPQDAGMAARFLAQCERAQANRDALEHEKARGRIPATQLAAAIDGAEAMLRRCQVVTPEMQSHSQALWERAMLGGFPGAASSYGELTRFQPPTPALRSALVTGLKNDAAVDFIGLTMLIEHGASLGLDRREIYAYFLIALKISNESPEGMRKAADSPYGQGLSEAERAEAEALAKQKMREMRQQLEQAKPR